MPHTPSQISQQADHLLSLQQSYIEHLKTLLLEIVQLRNSLAKETPQAESIIRLYNLIHNLCGSGSTFGFPAISETGQALALQLKPCLHSAPAEIGRVLTDSPVVRNLEAFEKVCHQAILSDLRSGAGTATLTPAPEGNVESKTVCILTHPERSASDIGEQLRHFGYNVIVTDDAGQFKEGIGQHQPHALIVYSSLSEAEITQMQDIRALGVKQLIPPQLIFISPRDDFEARLAAVRLGAQGYFTEPCDILQIIDKIEHLVAKYTAAPAYHVLIVDDDEMLMKFYTHALQRSGIITTSVSSPKEALAVIGDQAVDLVLIDFLMPGCNGQELATIIRQHEKYVSLPIIFMSARDDVESLLINTGLGIDDFLVKPITGDQLVSVVLSRAQRSAELQALMARDSFTGLLNHGHFMDMLAMELVQVKRYKTSAAYAIIDIDHFKVINDTYGHIAGDHVIKSLARMLQQRLRRSDIIGRCGGEEFGIIMPDCGLENASLIIESLRLQFSDLTFKVDQHDIKVTFSAGIASLHAYPDVDALIKDADSALYAAKNQGRNRLVIA